MSPDTALYIVQHSVSMYMDFFVNFGIAFFCILAFRRLTHI